MTWTSESTTSTASVVTRLNGSVTLIQGCLHAAAILNHKTAKYLLVCIDQHAGDGLCGIQNRRHIVHQHLKS
ncbi:MAG: hypothetical protein R2856_38360 [Caldilineaceae bacterium]